MWRWLLAKLPKRTTVFGSLWLISGSVHGLILLIALLMAHIDSRQTLVVTSGARRSSDARIVLLPMLKTVRGTQYDQPVRGTQFGVAATKKPQKNVVKQQVTPALKKPNKSVDKKSSKTTLASLDKTKQEAKKKNPQKTKDKTLAKKIDAKPPIKQTLKEVKSPEPIVAQAAIKEKVEPIVEQKQEEVIGDPNATQDVIYVGRDDLRAMQVQHVVSDALQKNWRPPSGIAKDTYCQISFDIDKEGKACNIVMQQQSKVLIFDVAARTALLQAHFNPAAEGQKFIVAFKP